jgi:hypothetical protein
MAVNPGQKRASSWLRAAARGTQAFARLQPKPSAKSNSGGLLTKLLTNRFARPEVCANVDVPFARSFARDKHLRLSMAWKRLKATRSRGWPFRLSRS